MIAKQPDEVINFIINRLKQNSKVKKVILFGSRARGDAKKRSDYDFAVLAPDISEAEWASLSLELQDNPQTLCSLDLVLLRKENQDIRPELYEHIIKEGIVIYEG